MGKYKPRLVHIPVEVFNAAEHLSSERAGRLLMAVFAYEKDGSIHDFSDDIVLDCAWSLTEPMLR